MAYKRWQLRPLTDCLIGSTLRNAHMNLNFEDLRSVNKLEGMIAMKDRVKGNSVDRCKIVKKNWFAYNPMRLNIGSICRWNENSDCIVSPDYIVFHCNEEMLSTDYFDQFRKSHRWNSFMVRAGHGSVRVRIYLKDLFPLKINLPPLIEQKKIVQILSTWDKAIDLTEKLIQAKIKLKKGLMQQLLTGRKRFEKFKREKWNKVKIEEISTVIMGQSPDSTAYNNEKVGLLLIQGNSDIKNRVTSPVTYTSQITKICEIGDIILSVRAPVGDVAKSMHKACIGRGVCAIRAKKVDKNILYQYLLFNERKWKKYEQGSTFSAINSKDIKSFYLNLPNNINEQQKKGLMQKLLTGQVRVKV